MNPLSPSYETCVLQSTPHCTYAISRHARPSSLPMQDMILSRLSQFRRSGGESLYTLLPHAINVSE